MKRRPTIVDVAKRAGVSKSLVSLVMRDAPNVGGRSREAVLSAARELGYRPNAVARSLVHQRSQVFGCVMSDLHNPFFSDVADGIEEAAVAGGYRALLSGGYLDAGREATAVDTLLQLQVDGLILMGPMMDSATIMAAADKTPVVVVGQRTRGRSMDSVSNDDSAGVNAVIDHLVELGHEYIAHIHAGAVGASRGRRRGYEAAMRRHGLEDRIRTVRGAFTEDGGRAATSALIASGDLPTAIFIANDFAAMGALDALDAAGIRVPRDLSIVGYDDIASSHSSRVALTTVAQPSVEIGRIAVRLLVERLEDGREASRHVVLPPRLVIRGTTAAPRDR